MRIIHTPRFKEHDTGSHPEQPRRVDAVREALAEAFSGGGAEWAEPRAATENELALVHAKDHVDSIRELAERGGGFADPDTVVSSKSYGIAKLAAGALLDAVDQVFEHENETAFAAVRPPGHHATANAAMGFCLFNNAAIAARYAQDKSLAKKVLILDWDVHHGNGTQDIFYEDDSVYYVSTHQYPHYPGTGGASERGRGKGEGYTRNLPFPAMTDPEFIVEAVEEALGEIIPAFKPGLIVISAGFDGHKLDPLGQWLLTEEHFARMTRRTAALAREHAGGKLLSCLEGGYNPATLGASAAAHCRALAEAYS